MEGTDEQSRVGLYAGKPEVCQNCIWRSLPICRKLGELVAINRIQSKLSNCIYFRSKEE